MATSSPMWPVGLPRLRKNGRTKPSAGGGGTSSGGRCRKRAGGGRRSGGMLLHAAESPVATATLCSPEVVIVHGGQVVVDEGHGVDHLQAARRGHGLRWRTGAGSRQRVKRVKATSRHRCRHTRAGAPLQQRRRTARAGTLLSAKTCGSYGNTQQLRTTMLPPYLLNGAAHQLAGCQAQRWPHALAACV